MAQKAWIAPPTGLLIPNGPPDGLRLFLLSAAGVYPIGGDYVVAGALLGPNAAAAGGVGLARDAAPVFLTWPRMEIRKSKKSPAEGRCSKFVWNQDLGRCRFTERRSDGSADAIDSRRRKRPELGQLQPAQPGQRQRARQGQRRQDDSDGIVQTRCDESPAHSRPQQWRHRWRRVRTRLRPRRPTWFSRTCSCAPFCERMLIHPPREPYHMAVNPAQPRVHEPDNSTAPKWRAALRGIGLGDVIWHPRGALPLRGHDRGLPRPCGRSARCECDGCRTEGRWRRNSASRIGRKQRRSGQPGRLEPLRRPLV
jgi:hypothetical protein